MGRVKTKFETSIFDVLIVEHRDVEALFEQIEALAEQSPQDASELFTVLQESLIAHAKAEESVVYPRFAQIKDLEKKIREAEAEHEAVETMIAEISATRADGDKWLARVIVLKENVQHHVKEEEDEVFPVAKKKIDDAEAKRLASLFLTAKSRRTGNPETEQARGRKPEKKRGLLARIFG